METVISRGDQNTRPRDYYDIYILTELQADNVDIETLAFALNATAKKRGSTYIIKQYREIMEVVKNSEVMSKQWENYQKVFDPRGSRQLDAPACPFGSLLSGIK